MSAGTGSRAKKSGSIKTVALIVLVVLVVAAVGVGAWLKFGPGGDGGSVATGPGGAQLEKYPTPTKLKSDDAKVEQTTIDECRALDNGGWLAKGVVKNDSDETVKYKITVFFMNGDDPINYAQTKLKVPAGETYPWVTEKVFGTDYELTCEVRAVS